MLSYTALVLLTSLYNLHRVLGWKYLQNDQFDTGIQTAVC
jgi:hypothetical protein